MTFDPRYPMIEQPAAKCAFGADITLSIGANRFCRFFRGDAKLR